MSGAAVGDFLGTGDLDFAADSAERVDPEDPAVRSVVVGVLHAWANRQAVANLLFHPSLIPVSERAPAMLRALGGNDGYLRLAAATGLAQADDWAEQEREQLVAALAAAIGGSDGVTANRAAESLAPLFEPEEAAAVFPLLDHPSPVVRHHLFRALFRMYGSQGMKALLADRSFLVPEYAVQLRRRLTAAGFDLLEPDGGSPRPPALEYLPNLAEWLDS
ncbi:hypothetical protein D1871_15840 [Nakamurella silvestris]|nr:hypothetical protein D1871_15840 [Nakamurella silvestris]